MTTANIAKQPASVWNRTVRFDYKKLLISAGKVALNLGAMNWSGAAKDILASFASVSLEALTWREQAWVLAHRALTNCLFEIISQSSDAFLNVAGQRLSESDLEQFAQQVAASMNDVETTIDQTFFNRPGELPFVKVIQERFAPWFAKLGLSDAQVGDFRHRIPDAFTNALHEEWLTNFPAYQKIRDAVDSPFLGAMEEQASRNRYNAWLKTLPNEPVFQQSFPLRDIYLPLRAY
ncbi:MAG: hypothetical protein AB7D07_12860 [Desulfovibrionaceae bacterium]